MNSLLKTNRLVTFGLLNRQSTFNLVNLTNLVKQHSTTNKADSNSRSQSIDDNIKEQEEIKDYKYPEYLHFYSNKYKTDNWTNLTNHVIRALNNKQKLYHKNGNPIRLISEGIKHHFNNYDHFEFKNPIVTTEANFDSLLIPKDHISRSKSDCYYLNQNQLLRAHSSAHQIDCLKDRESRRFFCIADVYRRDVIDSTHYPIFHQCEIFNVLDQIPSTIQLLEHDIEKAEASDLKQKAYTNGSTDYAVKQLKETIENYLKFLFMQDLEFKWVPAYFPFTTPSFELEIFYNGKWIEMLGCGIVKREILLRANLDQHIAFAAGFGLERFAMIKYEIPDIRLFWSQDTGFTSQFDRKSFNEAIKYKPISVYPQSPKDCSFWIDKDDWCENDFYDLVREIGGDTIEQVYLSDEYVNKEGRKSNTFRIIYRSADRTLRKSEVVEMHERIKAELRKRFGFETRG